MNTDVSVMWGLARASGLVAAVALTATVVCGLAIAGGVPGADRRRALELHEVWTLAAVSASAVHGIAVGVDASAGIPAAAIVVPLASERMTAAVAFGTLALWGIVLVAVSTLLRAHIGPALWRVLHGLAYGTFVLGIAHGLLAGTDTSHPVVLASYALAVGGVVGASVWRAVSAVARRPTACSDGARPQARCRTESAV